MAEPEDTPTPKSESDYNAEQIKALKGIEGIRHRPAMYIGGTDLVGLHHLVYEVTDNVLDEFSNGYAKTLNLTINADGSVTVVDDGRGIPVDNMKDQGNRPAVEVVFTEIHAGGKFNRDAYNTGTTGLHGVGVTAVNACSEWVECEIRRDGHVWQIEFAKGKVTSPLTRLGRTDQTGTKVTFKPDSEIFPDTTFVYDTLHKRLQDAAFLNAGLRVLLSDERTGQTDEFHYEDGLHEFVRYLNRTETPITDVIRIRGEFTHEREDKKELIEIDIAMQYNDGFSENIRCYGNGIYNFDGGTHLSGFRSGLTRTMNNYGKKENHFKEMSPTGDDFREGLAAVVTVRTPNPQFESQTKIKLVNTEVEGAVSSIVYESLTKYLEENPTIAKQIVNKGLRAAEAREAAKKARDMARSGKSATTGGLPDKLRDCRKKDLDVSELYLVEGDSAGGSADTGRDSETQAILPLRGKILNVEKAQLVKVLGNAEVVNIFRAVGVPPGAELEDVQKRRYGKIIVMTDADVDGSHIRTLLLTFIFRHMRELVKHGCVYIAQPPLYRVLSKSAKKNENARYVQTHEQMMSELIDLGKADRRLRCDDDGAVFEGEHLDKLIAHSIELEEPLETLERRGISLRYLVENHLGEDNLLPRYRVFVGSQQHWFPNKAALEEFLKQQEADKGELKVADEQVAETAAVDGEDSPPTAASNGHADTLLQVIDLHEVRSINQTLRELKAYGVTVHNLIPGVNKAGEPTHPWQLEGNDTVPLTDLRELPPTLRKIGEKGLRLTRFKGLGEMDPEELWETSMDADKRLLLQVTMEDAAAADEIFRVLMGDHVEPRREFIEKHALEVRDLDV